MDTHYSFDDNLSLSIDSIVIPLDSVSFPEYLSRASYYENDNVSLLYVFNHKTWHIQLNMEGNNGINDIRTLQVISMDSIFIYDSFKFIFIDGSGRVLNKINGTFDHGNYFGMLEANGFTVPRFIPDKNKFFGRYITTRSPYPFPEKELFASYDILTNNWQLLPIIIPEYFSNNWKQLGMNKWLKVAVYNDRITYIFSALSEVFVYLLDDNKNIMSGGASKLIDNSVPFYNGSSEFAEWMHWLDNPNFDPLIYNPHQKRYYRIAYGKFVGEPSYSQHGHNHKTIILSVFDESLKMIFETKLPNYKFNFFDYFPSKNGILVYGNNSMNANIDYEKLVIYCLCVQ